jgi:hypothetical protein
MAQTKPPALGIFGWMLDMGKPRTDVFLELQAEIRRREETIRTLKASGHRTIDAERELKNLKETAELIK